MISISLEGEDALQARLAAFPAEMIAGLATKAAILAQKLADKVKDDKLSGGALQAVSGALRASIVATAGIEADGAFAAVGSAGDVKYAAIQEYGGKTAAHDIAAVKAKALAFATGGATLFAKQVHHPGSTIPERSYLRASLAEMADEIIAALGGVPHQAWKRS